MGDFVCPLKIGDCVNNTQICKIFFCSPQGGMRRSRRTKTLVLISDHTQQTQQTSGFINPFNPYLDRWTGPIFLYTGMGLKGDQSFYYRQNRTLYESDRNGVEVHLFEVFDKKKSYKYEYQGIVKLAGPPYEPYMTTQPDANGLPRKVCIFPLKKISAVEEQITVSKEDFDLLQELKKLIAQQK